MHNGLRSRGGGHSGNSTIPTDPSFAYVMSLLHFDGSGTTITDNANSPKTWTAAGNATQSSAQSKFGGISLYTDNAVDSYVSAPYSADWDFGTGNYAIEFWFKRVGTQVYAARLFDRDATVGLAIYFNNDQSISVGLNGSYPVISSSTMFGTGWNFVQLVRDGATSTKLYVNGVQEGSTYTTNYDSTFAGGVRIGGYVGGGENFVGYIDDLRITKGSARAAALPTEAFPNS